jgi:transposase InsO family protein
MADATRLLAAWRDDCNNLRPHSALKDGTPAGLAAKSLEGTVPSRQKERSAAGAGLLQCLN